MFTRITLSRSLGICIFTACMLLVYSYTDARPVVIEETAKIISPDPHYPIVDVAIDGSDLLALGFNPDGPDPQFVLFHFEHQSDGSWLSRGSIASASWGHYYTWLLALENGIGLFRPDPFSAVQMLERTATGWNATALPLWTVSDAIVRDNAIVIGTEVDNFSAVYLMQKEPTGEWVLTREFTGARGFGDDDSLGPDIEITPTEAIAANYTETEGPEESVVKPISFVFDRVDGQWTHTSTLNAIYPATSIDGRVALRLSDWNEPGDIASFFTRASDGSWTVRYSLLTEEWFENKRTPHVSFQGDRAYAAMPEDDARGRDAGSIGIFTRTAPMRFTHSATLLASDATPDSRFGDRFAVRGRRIAALANAPSSSYSDVPGNAVYVFELPEPLPEATRLEDTFEDVNSTGWTPWGATDWRVRAINGSYVYRQRNVQGDARAILDEPTLENQGIEADVTVRSLGSTSWVGLMARYVDARNFYYLLVNNNSIQIRRMLNGKFGPLTTAPFSLNPNITHRFRLEAVGSWVRAFADGKQVAQVIDDTIPQGRVGLTMWKTAADFDNVIVSTSPSTELHGDETSTPWAISPAGAWTIEPTSTGTMFRQASRTVGDARAINGAPAADQIVSAVIRPRGFNASGTGWAGLITRYVDDNNYYYVLLGDNDEISVRKLSNGAITVLEEVPFTVNAGTSYRVRFEAVGSSLRLYVNGRLRAEGKDEEFATGRYGLMTYRAAADFKSFVVTRP